MSLKNKAASGMLWTFAEQFGSKLISFVVSIILARLLTPSDFGVIALFSFVLLIAGTIIDGGLGSSLIRTKNANEEDYSTVFFFNIGTSIVIYIIVFCIAPIFAWFYNVEILTNVIRLYCITLVISSFVTVQRTHFVKNFKFKTAFLIQLPSLLFGGITGVVLAFLGYGVWSLVYSAIVQSILFTLQHWFYSDWRPKWIFNKDKFKYHFSFGYKMALSGVINTLFSNLYTIVIGKYFSIQELGYYNRADTLKQLPVSNLSVALNKVTFPLFAEISHDDRKLREVYQKLLKMVIFIIAPVLIFLIVDARSLIIVLLTEKWLPAVPYFQILCISGILYPIHAYNLNILQVKGRSDLFLKLEIIKKSLVLITIVLAINFGMYALLWAQVFNSIIALFINTHYTGKFLNYRMLDQLRDLIPSMTLAASTGVIVYLFFHYILPSLSDVLIIILSLILFFTIYLSIAYFLRFKELNYAKEFIKK